MKPLYLPLLFMSTFSFNTTAGPLVKNTVFDTLRNTAYGEDPAQRMDIYLPAGRSAAQTGSLILLHGGGWNSGSRHNLSDYIDSFRKRMPGYAIFNIDYRLVSPQVQFGEPEKDIRSALDFIAAHADTYKINTARFVLVGVSAGAHLALLQAYKNVSPKIGAVIDFFGPADLTAMYRNPWNAIIPHLMESFIRGTPETNNAYRNLSPVSFINRSTPPTLIFHGRQDYIVDISQSKSLQQKLDKAGVPNKLLVYDNAGHGWFGNTLTNSFDHIEAFLKEYLED
jgi:acetyl esterase/lipase